MRPANLKDKEKAANIIAETFAANAGVNWMLSKKGNKTKAIKRLADYAFIKAWLRDGAFLSVNEQGVALCYKYNTQVFSLKEMYYQLRFALRSIPLQKLPSVLKREAYRKGMRPKDGNYYYYWFLGVSKSGSGAAFELDSGIKQLAKKEGLPIYLETTSEKNKIVYERMGYKLYHYWEEKSKKIKFWFLKLEQT
ncbi:MAG: hypothetical protein HKO56_04915 [Bacteroidia bacterium]|nr:hypothetical protein [Bacteroidia bacterium]NNM15979.1 hypothetical protein [Bacteroidia bacterium]